MKLLRQPNRERRVFSTNGAEGMEIYMKRIFGSVPHIIHKN
jgi:hypothetical protein